MIFFFSGNQLGYVQTASFDSTSVYGSANINLVYKAFAMLVWDCTVLHFKLELLSSFSEFLSLS